MSTCGIPPHWIGAQIGWEEHGDFGEALVSLLIEAFSTHGGCFGSSGGGKTTLIQTLIAQCILRQLSLVVLDMRRDLIFIVLELAARGLVPPENILLLDLGEKDRPTGFNPLAGSGEPYFKAFGLTDLLEQVSSSWGVQLGETVQMVTMLLAESGGTIADFERVFFDEPFRRRALKRASQPVRGYWERFGELPAEKQAALASPVLNKISLLLGPPILRRVLGHPHPADLASFVNRKGTMVLIGLAHEELHGAARLMANLTLSSICREIFARVTIPENQRNPVYLFVDEYEHFKSLDFPNILAEGRRFGLHLIVSFQVLAQVDPAMRSLLLNNIGVKAIFRTGRDDGAVLSADLFGDRKAYDFTLLQPGQCVLWQRGRPAIEIEVNEPIVQSVGEGSPAARSLRAAILARNAPAADLVTDLRTHQAHKPLQPAAPEISSTPVRLPKRLEASGRDAERSKRTPPARKSQAPSRPTSPEPKPAAPSTRAPVPPASLEDWLCE